MIRKLTDITFRISSLQEEEKLLNGKINNILHKLKTFVPHGGIEEREIAENDVMEKFPIKDIENLEVIENSLVDGSIKRRDLVSVLCEIKIITYYK